MKNKIFYSLSGITIGTLILTSVVTPIELNKKSNRKIEEVTIQRKNLKTELVSEKAANESKLKNIKNLKTELKGFKDTLQSNYQRLITQEFKGKKILNQNLRKLRQVAMQIRDVASLKKEIGVDLTTIKLTGVKIKLIDADYDEVNKDKKTINNKIFIKITVNVPGATLPEQTWIFIIQGKDDKKIEEDKKAAELKFKREHPVEAARKETLKKTTKSIEDLFKIY